MILDDQEHAIELEGKRIVLQPLSYRMFKALSQEPGALVSPGDLMEAVWGEVLVSPETLKQRAFLLRRALQDAGIESARIAAVRGEGYRLVLDGDARQEEKGEIGASSSARPWHWIVFLVVLLAAILYWARPAPEIPASNRVALWLSTPAANIDADIRSTHDRWKDMLLNASTTGDIQFIQSSRDTSLPIPAQARKNRIALISFMEVQSDTSIRLQIIEPHTSTVLRSDTIEAQDTDDMLSHLAGMQALIGSGKLVLSKEQKVNAGDPVWDELRTLANPENNHL